jgi:hypothetical protein
MAVMVASSISSDAPYSERRLFELLKMDPSTSDWTVLHSVGLRRTRITTWLCPVLHRSYICKAYRHAGTSDFFIKFSGWFSQTHPIP